MSRGLPSKVKLCLDKALDSALFIGLKTYNKTCRENLKSGGYIVFNVYRMGHHYFHAIFFQKGDKKPFLSRKKNKVRFKKSLMERSNFWELGPHV
jgi:hypothetical protein